MSEIVTGSILRFKLDHDFGFGYCRVVDFTKKSSLITLIVKVYNIYGEENYSLEQIIQSDYLLNPIRLYEYPNKKGRGAWKFIGVHKQDDDHEIPIFKKAPNLSVSSVNDEYECKKWWPLFDFSEKGDLHNYKQVGHLEHMYIYYKHVIVVRATMEIIKLEGKRIEDFYNVEDLSYKWHYLKSINIPFMRDIPKEYRGKIIDKSDEILKGKKSPFRSSQANPKSVLSKTKINTGKKA